MENMIEQDKVREAARLLLEWAEGKTLQTKRDGTWTDIHFPDEWRIKPEPRKAWSVGNYITENEGIVKAWRKSRYTVKEWQEVVS